MRQVVSRIPLMRSVYDGIAGQFPLQFEEKGVPTGFIVEDRIHPPGIDDLYGKLGRRNV